jgi:flavin-dependent dehydrogenase
MKVAIIGGGICGLYLAWKLSDKGNKVSVFEKKEKIGKDVVCSGLFSERIFDFIPQSRQLVKNKIKYCLLHFPKKTIKLEFSKNFYVIDHSELDKMTGSLAQESGVEIILNNNIDSLPSGYDRIIGCDGADSFVRNRLNLLQPKMKLGILGLTDEKSNDDFVEGWPVINSGFIWKIPRAGDTEYGIISDPKTAKKEFDGFLKNKNILLKDVKAKIIPQGLIIPKNNKITLCGDAAGLTKPWSGGGVVWGLKAADILLKSFPDFMQYRKSLKGFFLPKIIVSKTAINIVYFLGFNMPWILPKNNKMESDFLL